MRKLIGFFLSIAAAISMLIDGYIVFLHGPRHLATTRGDSESESSSPAKSSSTQHSGQYKNGTFTGKTVKTEWGTVQVRASIQNGQLTTINVLKYPNSEDYSRRLNKRVLPTYQAEAIKAQSANIHHVSGATVTYHGFKGSLQDALNQAKQSNQQNQQPSGR